MQTEPNVLKAANKQTYQETPSSQIGYVTVSQFAERNPAFTEAAVRSMVFSAEQRKSSLGTIPANGLLEAGAIVRIGRKVLIHEPRFFAWVEGQRK